MNLILDGAISVPTLDRLALAYNDIEEKGGALHIFFSSEGGEVSAGEAIIELINRYSQATTLTAHGMIASMGFRIFAEVKCTKVVLDSTYAICHLSRWGTQILEGGRALDDMAKFKEMQMRKVLSKSLKYYEGLGFKEEELGMLKEGKDVFLDSNRLKRIFKIK